MSFSVSLSSLKPTSPRRWPCSVRSSNRPELNQTSHFFSVKINVLALFIFVWLSLSCWWFKNASGCGSTPWFQPHHLFYFTVFPYYTLQDFAFILSGLTRLLNSPLAQTYLPGSTKKVQMHQELLVLFWRMCEINKKFMYYVLKSSQVLDLLVPILYHLNDSRSDPGKEHRGSY